MARWIVSSQIRLFGIGLAVWRTRLMQWLPPSWTQSSIACVRRLKSLEGKEVSYQAMLQKSSDCTVSDLNFPAKCFAVARVYIFYRRFFTLQFKRSLFLHWIFWNLVKLVIVSMSLFTTIRMIYLFFVATWSDHKGHSMSSRRLFSL